MILVNISALIPSAAISLNYCLGVSLSLLSILFSKVCFLLSVLRECKICFQFVNIWTLQNSESMESYTAYKHLTYFDISLGLASELIRFGWPCPILMVSWTSKLTFAQTCLLWSVNYGFFTGLYRCIADYILVTLTFSRSDWLQIDGNSWWAFKTYLWCGITQLMDKWTFFFFFFLNSWLGIKSWLKKFWWPWHVLIMMSA